MALRRPLVIVNGQVEQLQSGDILNADISGVGGITMTNDESSAAIVAGMPVYSDAADKVKRAEANASGTINVIGLVFDASITAAAQGTIQTIGIIDLTTAQWDAVAGTSGGLAFNTIYYLSPSTPGNLTATAPTTIGQYVCPVGIGLSATELELNIQRPILL